MSSITPPPPPPLSSAYVSRSRPPPPSLTTQKPTGSAAYKVDQIPRTIPTEASNNHNNPAIHSQQSINDKSQKISSVSKKTVWISVIIFGILMIAWSAFYLYCYWERKWLFNYIRPASLPNQKGPAITPTATGYNIPDGDLTDRVIYLGGEPTPIDPELKKKNTAQASGEIKAWKSNPNPGPVGDSSVSSMASAPYFL